jgi:hypothetical protein
MATFKTFEKSTRGGYVYMHAVKLSPRTIICHSHFGAVGVPPGATFQKSRTHNLKLRGVISPRRVSKSLDSCRFYILMCHNEGSLKWYAGIAGGGPKVRNLYPLLVVEIPCWVFKIVAYQLTTISSIHMSILYTLVNLKLKTPQNHLLLLHTWMFVKHRYWR